MVIRPLCSPVIVISWMLALNAVLPERVCGQWQEHRIRQADGKGGWITRPALRQVLKHPDATHTMPFGLAPMDNGEIALLCSREKQPPQGPRTFEPIIAFSNDGGATWSDFMVVPGTRGRPQYLTYLGHGRLAFVTEVFDQSGKPQRIFSDDYGRTWTERVDHPPTQDGMPFNLEGNAWVDRDEHGRAKAILELGWHYAPGKSHPKDDATVVFRRSIDGGKSWIDEVAPPQWKFTVAHNGQKWLRGVSEGAIVRAANGDLVAALRSDMPPRYFDGPHDDSLEGTAISLSHDDGKTWSPMQFLFDAGRHHANLQRLPNDDLVCTVIVRDDIRDGKLGSHRRGCDALISKDHGKTWNLDGRYELDRFDFLRADGYWVDGVCGHVGAATLADGHIISVYGNYPLGAVLIKWKPDAGPAQPVPKIGIQIGPQADAVERCGANELARYLDQLFHVETRPAVERADAAEMVFLVGTPATNPAVAQAVGQDVWPKMSDQGFVCKRVTVEGKPGLVIGGGSPAATLWAVYDLVERWGVRYLLHGDVLPQQPVALRLPETDVVLEPNLRVRQWRTVNDFACGPESWGLDEHRRVIDQLAKLRFNRLFISIWPYQPFLDLKVKGVERQAAHLWFDFHYPITDDMPGRHLFGNEPEFWNPDLPRGAAYPELAAAGARLIQGICQHARSRGMQCAISATLTEFPPEFAPLLADAQRVQQLGAMGIVPGPKSNADDPSVSDLAIATLRATVNTYPAVDYILLGMPEHRQWVGEYERAWQTLDRKYRFGDKVKLADIVAAAEKRSGYPGGAARAVQEVKGDIVLLYFYDRLLTELKAIEGTRRPDVRVILNSVAEELFPILPRILPPGSETLNFVDYTPARILKRRDVLGQIAARDIPTSLIYTLHDDNVGLVPQLATGSLHQITQDIRRHGWSGFSTRYWLIGDHDPCVAYLARTAWAAGTTPEIVYRDQVRATCGDACIDDMLAVFREVEQATVQLEWHGLGFTFPVPGMITNHWTPDPLPKELAAVRGYYERALKAARGTRAKASIRGRPFVDYWIGRLEFGVGYFDAVHAVRRAARAEADGNRKQAHEHAQTALDRVRAALESYARIAGDQSDRGAIATMAEYVYRPLKDKVAQLQQEAETRLPVLTASGLAHARSIETVIPKAAHPLQQHAASELQRYLERLFETTATVVSSPTADAGALILLGTSKDLPGVSLGLGTLPSLSDQGFLLRTTRVNKKPALLIVGGSPAATLWGVYELAHRYGVRYLLSGDVLPNRRQDFFLPEIDQVFEPVFRLRWWKGMGDFAMGTEGWGMADYRPLIDQLAKLKFNRIRVGSSPSQPFLHLEMRGVKQQFATLWYGAHFPITPDMPGRRLFGPEKEFWNPDLPLPEAGYEKLAEAGRRHCHELIAYAGSRGIEASFVGSISDFPRELSALVPDAQAVSQLGQLTVGPGAAVRPDNQALAELSGTVIRTIIDTYPEVESYGFPLGTEWNGWINAYEWAWRELDKQYGIGEVVSLEEVLRKAGERTSHDGAERCAREVKGGIAGLYFLARLWSSPEVLPQSRKPSARLVVYEPAEELFPILSRVLPEDAELVIVLDYNPTRVLRRRQVLATLPTQEVTTTLVLTLHDDSVGVLPLLTTESLHQLVSDMRRHGLSGFCTRQWLVSDHDPSVAYLSAAAWDPGATPEAVGADQVRAVCGQAAVEPMLEAFREIEAVTAALEDHGMGLTFPWPGMMMQHWTPEPLTKAQPEDRAGYERALTAVRRVPPPLRPEGQAYVQYWIGRLEFAVGYLDAIQAVKNAAIAEKAARDAKSTGDTSAFKTRLAEAIAQAETAQTAAVQAIGAFAGVAKNRADLGAIATLAEYAYRPLKRKVEELRAESEQ